MQSSDPIKCVCVCMCVFSFKTDDLNVTITKEVRDTRMRNEKVKESKEIKQIRNTSLKIGGMDIDSELTGRLENVQVESLKL